MKNALQPLSCRSRTTLPNENKQQAVWNPSGAVVLPQNKAPRHSVLNAGPETAFTTCLGTSTFVFCQVVQPTVGWEGGLVASSPRMCLLLFHILDWMFQQGAPISSLVAKCLQYFITSVDFTLIQMEHFPSSSSIQENVHIKMRVILSSGWVLAGHLFCFHCKLSSLAPKCHSTAYSCFSISGATLKQNKPLPGLDKTKWRLEAILQYKPA